MARLKSRLISVKDRANELPKTETKTIHSKSVLNLFMDKLKTLLAKKNQFFGISYIVFACQ